MSTALMVSQGIPAYRQNAELGIMRSLVTGYGPIDLRIS